MSDNVVKLQFDLTQTQAALEKSQAAVAKLREEVKKTKEEMKNAGEAGSAGFQKQSTALRTQTKEVETQTAALRKMGGALNQIGGAGTGQISMIAGSIGMLASPIGLVAASLSVVGFAWSSISAKIEEAKKRTEEFEKSIKKVNDESAKQSADVGKKATDRGRLESLGKLGVTYSNPEETLRKMREDYGFKESENIGILSALQPRMRRVPKDQQQKTLGLIMNAIQAANVGAGIDPVDAAKGMIESPTSFSNAASGRRYSSAASVSSKILGFRVPWEQIQTATEERIKSPSVIESFRAERLAAKIGIQPEPVDVVRAGLKTTREELEGSMRGGSAASEIIQKQVEAQRKRKAGYGEYNAQEYIQIVKLKETLQEQNPSADWVSVQLFIDKLTTAIEENTKTNRELKTALDENNKKTTENTEATATGMVK